MNEFKTNHDDSFDALTYATAYFEGNKLTAERIDKMAPYTIKKVIFSGPKTIVLWEDGTKTIVSLRDGDQADCYAAFCQAVVKKIFGSTGRAKKILDEKAVVQPSKALGKKPEDAVYGPHDMFGLTMDDFTEMLNRFEAMLHDMMTKERGEDK